jgi:hypothetical protein
LTKKMIFLLTPLVKEITFSPDIRKWVCLG